MDGVEPVEMDWLKLRTGKSSNSFSEFSEKSGENSIQGADGGVGLTQEEGECLTDVGEIEVIEAVQAVCCKDTEGSGLKVPAFSESERWSGKEGEQECLVGGAQ